MTHIFYEMLLLFAVALWGASFALTKPLLDVMGVFTFMSLRFIVGGLFLVVILMALKKLKLDKNSIKGGLLTGFLLFLAFIFHTYGLKYTTVSKNAFIVGSNVIFVPIVMTLFRKEKHSLRTWISTGLAMFGLALVTLDGTSLGINIGDGLTIVGTLVVAFYILSVEKYVRSYDPLAIATLQVLTVGFLSIVPALFLEQPPQTLSPFAIRNLFLLSFGCTSIAYLIANLCQRVLSATRTSLLYVFEPIFGALLGWFLLGDTMGAQGILGALFITFATIFPLLSYGEQSRSTL